MTLDEFRKHPAYIYYLTYLVDNLYNYLKHKFKNYWFDNYPAKSGCPIELLDVQYIIEVENEIKTIIKEQECYSWLYCIRRKNRFYFYLKEHINDK